MVARRPTLEPVCAALARARGYIGQARGAAHAQPVLKPVVAVAGDIVEIGPRR
jgi:type IV secretory pathway protease TraF